MSETERLRELTQEATVNDDNVFDDAVMPDAGDLKEIEIYKAFRKWRASKKKWTIPEAYRAGYAQAEALAKPPSTERQVGWLIEQPDPSGHLWLRCDVDKFQWTKDSLQAIRFARREDAEQLSVYLQERGLRNLVVTEHIWGME
jgi:hypothetical protein